MATVLEALRSINGYPIPTLTLAEKADRRGLRPDADATLEVLESPAFRLAEADLLIWLSIAPNVSQGGQSYSLGDAERVQMRRRANDIYDSISEAPKAQQVYGYKGSRL